MTGGRFKLPGHAPGDLYAALGSRYEVTVEAETLRLRCWNGSDWIAVDSAIIDGEAAAEVAVARWRRNIAEGRFDGTRTVPRTRTPAEIEEAVRKVADEVGVGPAGEVALRDFLTRAKW